MDIKIKTPAKLNLTLEVVNKRPDGFHNIKSVMQTIDLYDYLTFNIKKSNNTSINLSGTSSEIPYDSNNLIFKAAELFFNKTGISGYKVDIYLEKNIPVSAGLAGGSSNAAGTLYGLNKMFDDRLSKVELHELCGCLGSDLNVCLEGGCLLATGRGETVEKLPFVNSRVSLIKPDDVGISAKEAYTKYSLLKNKPNYGMTSKMVDSIKIRTDIRQFLYNDLEMAIFDDYKEFQLIKRRYPHAVMTGSGSAYFMLNENFEQINGFWVKNGLNFIPDGVSICMC